MRIQDKPFRPLEVDLSGDNGNVFTLVDAARLLCDSLNLDIDQITEELKAGDLENAVDVFDYYFDDYAIIYR